LEGEDGTSEPRFDILHLPADSTPAIPMFLCRHRTPELVRLPGWTDQPNGVTRIVSVAVPVTDPLATVSAHERLLGALSVTITDDMVTLRTGTASILLATQKSLNQLYPDLLPEPDEGACPALVTLAVGDLDGTAGVLAANAILMLREPNALAVAAEDACGIAMVFDGSA
ncbi:MAG: hypothetical protein P8Q36_17265, partial [Alphaproteobacteria bacterium]|nr:hypothetical protein [Alphaproteobacteria bacterium]